MNHGPRTPALLTRLTLFHLSMYYSNVVPVKVSAMRDSLQDNAVGNEWNLDHSWKRHLQILVALFLEHHSL